MSIYTKRIVIVASILIIAAGFFAYQRALPGKFILDDEGLVRENIYIRSFANVPRIMSRDIASGWQSSFYRPLQILSYAFDYSIWKLNPFGYHLTNTLLHIIASLLVMWFLYILFGDFFIAWLSALLFCIHPVQTEAVAYISGRADSLALIFMLLSFIFYLKNSKPITLIFSLVCFALALLSKELALVLPLLVLAYHAILAKKINIKAFASLACVASIYIVLRLTLLHSMSSFNQNHTTLLGRLPGFFVALASYVRLLCAPVSLHMEYGNKLFPILYPKAIDGLTIFIALLVIIMAMRKRKPLIAFAVSWFLVALIPQSNFFPINAFMAEHWLYVPSIGFCLIIAWLVSQALSIKELVFPSVACIFAIVFACMFLTVKQCSYWRNPSYFYERTMRLAPDSPGALYGKGSLAAGSGNFDTAVAFYKKALVLDPLNASIYYDMGVMYKKMGSPEQAQTAFEKALSLDPRFANAYTHLGILRREEGKTEEARGYFEKALSVDPENVDALNNIGALYFKSGKTEGALVAFQKAVRLDPENADAFNNLGVAYRSLGKMDDARRSFERAVEKRPNFSLAFNNLGSLYYALNRLDDAEAMFLKAIEADPRFAEAYNNTALLYYYKKNLEKAKYFYEKAKSLGWDNTALRDALGAGAAASEKQ